MSFSLFKTNIISYMRNQKGIEEYQDFSTKFIQEYDSLIKRGQQSFNFVRIDVGGVDLAELNTNISCQSALSITEGPHTFLDDVGNAILAYWQSAQLSLASPPSIPATGAILNLQLTGAIITNPGVITPPGPLQPTDDSEIFVDKLVNMIRSHLFTVEGIYFTLSLYPTFPPTPPAPGVLNFKGWTIPDSGGGSSVPSRQDETNTPTEINNAYDNLDWSKIPLDKNDEEVQEIIKPKIAVIDRKIRQSGETTDLGFAAATQMNNVKAEIIDSALYDQGLVSTTPDGDKTLSSGYKSIDELLKIAGAWAPKLGKNPRVRYENLNSGYIKGVHGLCPQGTQAVVVALTGIPQLGRISGNADWFSVASRTTGNGRSSFAINVNGKTYYNDRVKVDKAWLNDKSKWQVGDILVSGYTPEYKYGHIQVWTGWNWVSDFKQNSIQQRKVDFNTLTLWRLNENGKQVLQSQKNKPA